MTAGLFCFHCNAQATKLCDHILGISSETGLINMRKSEVVTCNRPLCDACAAHVGFTTLRGGDTIDLCRDHHAAWDRENRDLYLVAPLRELLAEQRRLQIKLAPRIDKHDMVKTGGASA